jgi:DNA-binding SARP family transcriptional activator
MNPLASIHLLGPIRVTTTDGTNITPRSRKTQGVLGYLCLCPGGIAARASMAELLWSDRPSPYGRDSLRHCVRELRAAFGPHADSLIRSYRNHVQLRVGRVRLDVVDIDLVAARGGATGDLMCELDGCDPAFDQWLITEREAQRARLSLQLQNRLAQTIEGPTEELLDTAAALLRLEPTAEAAHRALMLHHARTGSVTAALVQYQRCVHALARVGAMPSSNITSLVDRIRLGAHYDRAQQPPVAGQRS